MLELCRDEKRNRNDGLFWYFVHILLYSYHVEKKMLIKLIRISKISGFLQNYYLRVVYQNKYIIFFFDILQFLVKLLIL